MNIQITLLLAVVLMSASCSTHSKTPDTPRQKTSAKVKIESSGDHANQKQALSNGNTVFCFLGKRKGSMQCHSPEGKSLWEVRDHCMWIKGIDSSDNILVDCGNYFEGYGLKLYSVQGQLVWQDTTKRNEYSDAVILLKKNKRGVYIIPKDINH